MAPIAQLTSFCDGLQPVKGRHTAADLPLEVSQAVEVYNTGSVSAKAEAVEEPEPEAVVEVEPEPEEEAVVAVEPDPEPEAPGPWPGLAGSHREGAFARPWVPQAPSRGMANPELIEPLGLALPRPLELH